MAHLARAVCCSLLFAAAGFAQAQEASSRPAEAKKPARPPVYDEKADAKAQIAAALVKAKKEHKRVLIQFGANWCGWCIKLHDTLKKERTLTRQVTEEFEYVSVDVGRFDKNKDIAEGYGAKLESIPFLTVLDEEGKVLVNQKTEPLEEAGAHSVAKVKAFLDQWQVPPVDGEKALEAALARAKAEDKMVFLHFGAPWCGWCHRLEDFLARPEIAAVVGLDFVDLKIDEDRMTHAKEIEARYQKTGGIPWLAFLDGEGKAKATSTMPNGKNTGYPSQPEEITHFVAMLEKTKKRITSDQIAFLEKELVADRTRREADAKAAQEKRAREKEAAEKK